MKCHETNEIWRLSWLGKMFKDNFKYYKKRNPLPDLTNVIDFNCPDINKVCMYDSLYVLIYMYTYLYGCVCVCTYACLSLG